MILSANPQEAQVRDMLDAEMVNFARRVPEVVPFAPDAVLLQEVVKSSAGRVAQLLKDTTGFAFDVARGPGPHAVVGRQGGQIMVRDTAILLNRRTMRIEDQGVSFAHAISPETPLPNRSRASTSMPTALLARPREGSASPWQASIS